MGPNTALICSLLICCLVDVRICLSSGEGNLQSPHPALITDIITEDPDEKVDSSGSELSRRYKRDYDDEEVDGAPPDHQVPYSEHEDPEEPPTKPKYVKPGDWAKPPPDRNIPLDFVPTKLYAQVRGTHTVKRVPREEAIATAETAEEILSAPRLREVVSKSKKNTIYTEEGYEDSAYDHAGHIRDADFHEGFARKLDDKRKSKQDSRNKKYGDEEEEFKDGGSGDDEEELKNEESGDDEEFNEYDDDYRDHAEESRVEETKPPKRGKNKADGEKNRSIKGLLRNPDVNPKHVTENEIVRLEEDLEKEYAESEKNVEDQVPENLNQENSGTDDEDEDDASQSENLKNPGKDDENESEESKSEEDYRNDYDYGKRMDKNIDASREASRQFLKSQNGERKFGNKEFPVASSTQSANEGSTLTPANPTALQKESAAGFTVYEDFRNSQSPPDFSSTTPNYGKVFWDYFKLVGDHWKPKGGSTSSDITTTMAEAATLIPEEITSVPTVKSVSSTLQDIETFSFSPPTTFSFSPSTTELSDFVFSSTNMGPAYPRADSLYESWKRQDRGVNSEESPDFGNMEAASNSYPEGFEATTKYVRDQSINVKQDETTTLMSPKKLSYTVIIRPRDKSTTTTSPCDHQVHNRPEPTNSIGQLTSPKYTKMLKYLKDQPSPQEINNIAVKHQDFTVIQPPLSVPLRQVTYNDFLPDTYGSSVRQSVTQESGQLGKKLNGGRDWYRGPDNPYDKRFSNLLSHASEPPHFHHNRHGHHQSSVGKQRSHHHRYLPPTKLLPPSPMVRSSYAEYLGGNRLAKPRTRFDRSRRSDSWDGLLELYRTIDRSLFGRRRRRSLGTERKIEELRDAKRKTLHTASNHRGKVNYHSFDASSQKDLPERNFLREEANRLVALDATAIVNLPSDGNLQREKTSAVRRRRNHEELLKKSPKIAEDEINAEIESRFNDDKEDDEEEDEENYNDSEEKQRGKVDVEIPDFDVSGIIKETNENKNEKIISKRPTKANKLDIEKYPFYENSRVPQSSALKYITNPRQVPRKTLGGTEFYDSRDRYLECDEVEPNLERVLPDKEEPMPDREQQGDEPRLHGLGDKLDCFRAKYFDKDPLDNPLFLEKHISQPRAPEEFDPVKFASRIFEIPTDNQEQRDVVVRASRKPEIRDLRRSGSRRNQVTHKDDENSRQVNNKNHRREQEEAKRNRRNRRKRPETPGHKEKTEPPTTKPPEFQPVTPYERQVYEDVMGTIKNLAGLYQAYGEPVSPPLVPTDVNHVSAGRETDYNYPVRISERPRSFLIHGLLPPQTTAASDHQPLQRYRAFPYRTNKVSYRTRVRSDIPPGGEGIKIGYFKTVRVHKRSVDDTEIPGEADMKKSEIIAHGKKKLTISKSFKKRISKDGAMKKKPTIWKLPGKLDIDPKKSGNITKSGNKKLNTSSSFNQKLNKDIEIKEKFVAKKVPEESDLDTEESRNFAARGRKNLPSGLAVKKTTIRDIEKQEKPAASERVVYTIRDRIRYSKPRNGYGKNGKFSNLEAAGTEDVRRHEPRYNQIRRNKVSSSTIDPSTNSSDEQVEDVSTTIKPVNQQDKTTGRQDFHDEPGEIYKIQFSTTRGTQTVPAANRRRDDDDVINDEEDYEEDKQSGESRNDDTKENNYAVRENLEDDVTTVSSLNIEPTEAPEYRKLQKYLQSEPPGYSEAFTETSAEPDSSYNEKRNNEKGEDGEEELDDEDEEPPTKSYERAETRRDNDKEQEGREDDEQGDEESERPSESYADEESSGKSGEADDGPESPNESESFKNTDDEEAKDDDNSHDGEEEFYRFASRPFSPYESYDDPKYSDLGPRLSKPAFYHPSFSKPTSSKNRRGEYSAESDRGSDEEGSEKTSRYVFPWEQDEAEDVEETKDSEHSIGRYEYPWEKRERLAKERRKKEKARRDYEKLFTFSDDSEGDEEDEEEQNASNTELRSRRIYPWDYDVPSKNHHRKKIQKNGPPIDNVEVGTEYRPVTKFSSRYKSRIFNLHDEGDPIVVSGGDPNQIRVSVIESIKKASETKPVDPIQVLKNIVGPTTTPAAINTTNSYRAPGGTSTKAPRRLRNWKKTPSTSSTTTIAPTTTNQPIKTVSRPRTWRIASTTTKKPIRTRKRVSSLVDNELIKSGSQNKEIRTKNTARKNDTNSSTISPLETTSTPVARRKIRRRGQIINRPLDSSSTTARPERRRLSKSTAAPKIVEETTIKSVTDRSTTPKSKTVEHRSSFSKEEIITKTLYPRSDDEDKENRNDRKNKDYSKNERKEKDFKKGDLMNESVKKVSIVTKETPEHIYRTEEIDRDGVKGMFVSITPNNGSSSMTSMEDPKDRPKDDEDTKEMMKRFRDFDVKEDEQNAEGSLMQDSHLMANLLRQVPPFFNDLTFDENFQQEGNNFLETEGSGDVENDEDDPDDVNLGSRITYEKDPNNRLYYYVEK